MDFHHISFAAKVRVLISFTIRRKTRRVEAGGKNSEAQRVKMSSHLKDEMFQCEIMIGHLLHRMVSEATPFHQW